MDFKIHPGLLSVECEWDGESSTIFTKAQCKECGNEFEWSEKTVGGYVIAEIIQDLFLNATKGLCTKCRIETIERTACGHEEYVFICTKCGNAE